MSAPLVILPGLMCDSRMFEAQARAFNAIVIDDFYGPADHLPGMAQHALAVLPHRFSLLGHSMGGRIALEIWRLAPERVERLALADTGVHPVQPGEAQKRYHLRDIGLNEGIETLTDIWLPPMIGPAHRDNSALLGLLRTMVINAGVETFARQTEALLHRPNVEELLPSVNCPLFAIVGRDDTWSPVAQHQQFIAQHSYAQLRVIENAGHMAPAEEPEAFNAALWEWMKYAVG